MLVLVETTSAKCNLSLEAARKRDRTLHMNMQLRLASIESDDGNGGATGLEVGKMRY